MTRTNDILASAEMALIQNVDTGLCCVPISACYYGLMRLLPILASVSRSRGAQTSHRKLL